MEAREGLLHIMIDYTPPTTEDLQRLKTDLGLTGEQMAELVSLGGSHQWRKYTGGMNPRPLSLHALFFLAARLTLNDEQMESIKKKMEEIGANLGDLKNHKF